MTPTRRALLTGATGFVGRHLSRRLLADGWEVAALVRDPRSPRIVPGIGAHVVPDEHGALVDLVAAVDPEVCIHLATYFVGDHRTADVRPLVDANLTFGTRLADALVCVGGIPLVNTGTAWQHVGGAPYAPMSLYAATKQAFADILRFHATRRHLEVVTLTLTDTYGPGDDRPKLVPALLAAGLTGGPLDLSTGDQLIDLVHVDDVVAAFAGRRPAPRGPPVSPSGDAVGRLVRSAGHHPGPGGPVLGGDRSGRRRPLGRPPPPGRRDAGALGDRRCSTGVDADHRPRPRPRRPRGRLVPRPSTFAC